MFECNIRGAIVITEQGERVCWKEKARVDEGGTEREFMTERKRYNYFFFG